jgi:hypothetical protein
LYSRSPRADGYAQDIFGKTHILLLDDLAHAPYQRHSAPPPILVHLEPIRPDQLIILQIALFIHRRCATGAVSL